MKAAIGFVPAFTIVVCAFAQAAEHPMEEVGARLRSLMPWLREDRLVDRSKN